MKIIFLRISILVFSTLIVFGLVEAGLRLSGIDVSETPWKNGEMQFFRLDSSRIYALNDDASFPQAEKNSNYYKTDKYGLRYNPSHTVDRAYSNIVLMLGDSFTYGKGVTHEEAYPYRVEKMLQNEGYSVIVHNAGVPGYGIDQEYIYVSRILIPKFRPNIIVWNIHANDINDTNNRCLANVSEGRYRTIQARYNSLYIQGALLRSTNINIRNLLVYKLFIAAFNHFTGTESFTFGCTKSARFPRKEMYDIFEKKLSYYISELKKQADATNTKLIVTVVPFQYYFDDSKKTKVIISDYQKTIGILKAKFPEYIDLNLQLSEEVGATDSGKLSPVSSVVAQPVGSYYEKLFLNEQNEFDGSHLNRLGNEYISEIMARNLVQFLKH